MAEERKREERKEDRERAFRGGVCVEKSLSIGEEEMNLHQRERGRGGEGKEKEDFELNPITFRVSLVRYNSARSLERGELAKYRANKR